MKILLYSDNHFCSYSSILRDRGENFSLRLENQIQSLNWVEQLSKEHGCDLEICLGDFFDKETLNSEEISALREIKWNNIEKHFIVGNHEMGSSDLTYNSMNVLSSIGKIYSKATVLRFDAQVVDFIILPYILESNRKSLEEHIHEAYKNAQLSEDTHNYKYILTHNDIAGVKYGGFESKIGFDIDEINKNCFRFFDGHIHNQTGFGNKCFILGNLTGLNFSEDATKYKHCAYILDTITTQLEEYENPFALNFYKFDNYNTLTLSKVKKNAIISLKVTSDQVTEARETLKNNPAVLKFRISIIPEQNRIDEHAREQLISKDHIAQFKDYILQILGDTDIVREELRSLE